MKLILSGEEGGAVRIAVPIAVTMTALTNGGLGAMPGDAVTDDLEEAQRQAASESMTKRRAIDNMVREGHPQDFATKWCDALLLGGETDATALDLIRRKSFMGEEGQAAISPSKLPSDRTFRDAWLRVGDGVQVDMVAARLIFARRLIGAKARRVGILTEEIEAAVISGNDVADLEADYETLAGLDLRALGGKVMLATALEELRALWPLTELGRA